MPVTQPSPTTPRTGHAVPVLPAHGRLRPLGLDEVRITGGFWARRQQVNAEATLAHIEHWVEHEGWLANFDHAAAGTLGAGPGLVPHAGREFADSEVYKLLEAMSWEIGRSGDAGVEHRLRALVARVAAAQQDDGYLGTQFGGPGQPPRYSDLAWGHELYCYGHLLQAAVARARTRPGADDGLLDVARRAADHVCREFGPTGRQAVCGHPEIETALVELARVTGDDRYRRQAALFVERRGHGTLPDVEFGRAYYQDDVPVREATVLRGHAVRANYLAAGAVDVAVDTGDDGLLSAVAGQWERTVARRTYLTGGQGSHHQDEAYGDDWVLPPDRAYSETCAGVGSIMLSWRLLLAQGDPRYADLIERTLFNVVATSPAPDGRAFYYTNTLHQRRPGTVPPQDVACPRAASSLRAPWFTVSCCPPNVARTVAGLAAYLATGDDDGVQLHQYASARIRTTLPDGTPVDLDVATAYPADGLVRVRVVTGSDRPWTLGLRVPAWADGATLREPGGSPARTVRPGTASVTRAFAAGDVVELRLPTAPRLTAPDPRIDAVRGCLAVERGPEVWCLESTDLPGALGTHDVAEVRLDASAGAGVRERDGRVVVRLVAAPGPETDAPWPYPTVADGTSSTRGTGGTGGTGGPGVTGGAAGAPRPAGPAVEVPLVPYHDWAQRGPSTMRVWLPVR